MGETMFVHQVKESWVVVACFADENTQLCSDLLVAVALLRVAIKRFGEKIEMSLAFL
jgi:hypothetical protein